MVILGPDDPWWRSAVLYQVYLPSFADGSGDGFGDLSGLMHRLPHLVELGVDGLWITPWYPSPMADGGYDVSDYCAVDPLFGSLADADAVIGRAHELGLRLIIDMVPNHTSQEHPWFTAAVRAGPGSPERERYVFRDGRGPGGDEPPNNWISAFEGSAWTRLTTPDGAGEQWYLHTFAEEQPDLNWRDPGVRSSFDDILRFWLDRGIDGLRLDAVPAMAKVDGLPDADYGDDRRFLSADWVDNPHWDVPTIHDIFRRWRRLVDGYGPDRVLVAEAVVRSEERLADYLRPDELHTAFNFSFLHSSWDAAALHDVIDATLVSHERVGAPPTWALGNHDEIRQVTRLGRRTTSARHFTDGEGEHSDRALGTRRARAAILLMLALPGSAYIYQGEELGLPQITDLPDHVLRDPVFRRSGGLVRGRDGCRVPIPWSGRTSPYGFSGPDSGPSAGRPAAAPWLPQPAEWADLSVEAEAADPGSMFALYREALRLRRDRHARVTDFAWSHGAAEGVLDFRRGDVLRCVVNLSDRAVPLDPSARVLLGSDPSAVGSLPPDAAVWLVP